MSLMTLETPSRERVPVKSRAHLPLSLLPRCSHPFPPSIPNLGLRPFSICPIHLPLAPGGQEASDSRGVRGALQYQRSGGN